MPKRTIAVVYYATADGKTYPRGREVELSEEEAARGDKLRAFAENFGKEAPKEQPAPKPEPVEKKVEEAPEPEAAEPKVEEPKEEKPKPKPRRKRSS